MRDAALIKTVVLSEVKDLLSSAEEQRRSFAPKDDISRQKVGTAESRSSTLDEKARPKPYPSVRH